MRKPKPRRCTRSVTSYAGLPAYRTLTYLRCSYYTLFLLSQRHSRQPLILENGLDALDDGLLHLVFGRVAICHPVRFLLGDAVKFLQVVVADELDGVRGMIPPQLVEKRGFVRTIRMPGMKHQLDGAVLRRFTIEQDHEGGQVGEALGGASRPKGAKCPVPSRLGTQTSSELNVIRSVEVAGGTHPANPELPLQLLERTKQPWDGMDVMM